MSEEPAMLKRRHLLTAGIGGAAMLAAYLKAVAG